MDASSTIPQLPLGFVPRENVNMTIEAMLRSETDAVLIQGREGVGKTTVLNSYARSRGELAIALFLRPLRGSYLLPAVVAEIFAQLCVATGGEAEKATPSPSQSDLVREIQRAGARLNSRNQTLTFVVDGLAEVLARDPAAARDIVELLPLTRAPFRFLFSGEIESLLLNAGLNWRAFPLAFLSIEEARQMFAGTSVDELSLTRAYKACNGMAAQLAAVRRLTESGVAIVEILEKQPGDLANTMVLEWERSVSLTRDRPAYWRCLHLMRAATRWSLSPMQADTL